MVLPLYHWVEDDCRFILRLEVGLSGPGGLVRCHEAVVLVQPLWGRLEVELVLLVGPGDFERVRVGDLAAVNPCNPLYKDLLALLREPRICTDCLESSLIGPRLRRLVYSG